MIFIIDIDGTICGDSKGDYEKAIPLKDRIEKVNKMFDEGHEIHYWTARGATSGIDYTELTTKQLDSWGCKYTSVRVGGKPHYDIWVDDKAHNSDCLLYTSPSPRDGLLSRMPSSA